MTLYSASSTWTAEEHHLFGDSVQKFYEQEMVPNINKWNIDIWLGIFSYIYIC